MTNHTIVVGGGVGGLAAARQLTQAGHRVTVLEGAPTLGGLADGFEILGTPLERYYHYVLPQETDIQDLITEVGLADRLEWHPGSIGILIDGKVWPFTSPIDLLRFAPLPFHERIRAGIGALRLGRVRDWLPLDRRTARDWLEELTSRRVREVVWDPLLRAKFGPAAPEVPAAWMWGRLDQRRRARKGSGEVVGYLRGGFGQLFHALGAELEKAGATVRTSSRVDELLLDGDRLTGVRVGDETIAADAVLFCGTLPALTRLVPPDRCDQRWLDARGLGALCVVIDLAKPLTPVFWTNVCDEDLPFGGIIEHTRLVPPEQYGGRHVVYLSRYFNAHEDIATVDVDAEVDRWVQALISTFGISHDDIGSVHGFRTPYAAPLVTVPYLHKVPPIESHLRGLFLATTAQIYPQDRGMDEGIRRARIAAGVVADSGWTCPVCGSHDGAEAYALGNDATEGGVDPTAFRPSSNEYGQLVGRVLRCAVCGHGSVERVPSDEQIAQAYADASDPVSLREEAGQVATADRAVEELERVVSPGHLLDVGCWTGSFLVAARERGWDTTGVEPSQWASDRARERGLHVLTTELDEADLAPASFDAIACCDVLEHLTDPGATLDRFASLLRDEGALFITVPDAGSRLARAMGKRWWAIVPMHLQYFTRDSMRRLLEDRGFEVTMAASHPKLFSARYYAERLGGFVRPLEGPIGRLARRGRWADRLVGPDFGDRMQIVAKLHRP